MASFEESVNWMEWKKNRNTGVSRHRNQGERGKRGNRNRRGGGGRGRRNEDESVKYENREKPPPGLRGREIGLWYSRRSKERKARGGNEVIKSPLINVYIKEETEAEIRNSLDKVKVKCSNSFIKKYSNTATCSSKVKQEDVAEEKCGAIPKTKNKPQVEPQKSDQTVEEKYSHLGESRFKRLFLKNITGSITEVLNLNTKLDLKDDEHLNRIYKQELLQKQGSKKYERMMNFRMKLPSYTKQQEIIDVIEKNNVVVISGETGCGKTTQVAQFILDNEIMKEAGSRCRIICTQPRRISAISVAERVADERDEQIGDGSVGYQIRLESKLPRTTGSIVFCTTGILLQYMQGNPALTNTSHVIIDEIHERDTLSDFAITILKDVLAKRSDLKLILMSATLNAEKFSKYYNNCPMLSIPGFTFPVTEHYLEDVLEMIRIDSSRLKKFYGKSSKVYTQFIEPHVRKLRSEKKYSKATLDLLLNPSIEESETVIIYELICYICHKTKQPGAILVFLPGWSDISALNKMLTQSNKFPPRAYEIIPLHSLMPTAGQKKVFDRPPDGVRKIVIATNIAETSITIDDIVFVIDCGKIKMKNFDVKHNIATLKPEWVSLANARQRRGRAGRVQDGVCFHLFSKAREMTLDSYQLPEMLRTRLEEVILQVKILQLGYVAPFLQKVLEPPDSEAIELSIKILCALNALDEDEMLTPLGYHLAQLPLDPQTGKMILMAALFKCIDPIFTIAASLSFKDAFIVPMGKEDEIAKIKGDFDLGRKSDHLMMAEMYSQWERAESEGWGSSFCSRNHVSRSILFQLRDMKKQFTEFLYRMNFLNQNNHKSSEANYNSNNVGLLRAIICSGLYPNVAQVKRVKLKRSMGRIFPKLITPEDGKVLLHPKSVNSRALSFESNFMVYYQKLRSCGINIYDSTMVHSLPLIFFGGNLNMYDEKNNRVFEFPNGIRFALTPSAASLIMDLRIRLDWLLEEKVSNPGVLNWRHDSDEGRVLGAITHLITGEDRHLMDFDVEDDEDNYEDDNDCTRYGNY